MVSRKLERLISPGKWIHNLSVLSLSILSAGIFFFVLSESVAYLIFRDKIKDYTSDVLVRSESLLVQTESVKTAAKSHVNIGDSPCTNENILHLRVVVWPYPLIKDAVYRILAAPTPLYYKTKLAHLSKYYIRCSVFLHQITSWFLCYLSSSERLFSNAFPCASSR
jgi:hypothetical protein